jgi:two-component system sensor histidine kinase PilS (NtrC family)
MPDEAVPATRSSGQERQPAWFSIPDVGTVLQWLIAQRLILATGALWRVALAWNESPESTQSAFLTAVVVIVVFVLSAYGHFVVRLERQVPSESQLYVQAFADVVAIITVVHLTGGERSPFPALFVLIIAAYSLYLSFGSALLVTVLSFALYFADAMWGQPEIPGTGFVGQLVVFSLVFAAVSVLAARLRTAGARTLELESELRRVRLEAEDVLRTLTSGVVTIDPLGRLAYINPMAERLLGLSGRRVIGLPAMEGIRAVSPALADAIGVSIRTGRRIVRSEGVITKLDGTSFPIGLSITTLEQMGQSTPSVTAIFTDISDQKKLQELHLRAERLEAVAELSASLAHEIRNPLAAIRSSIEQLSRSPRTSEDEKFLAHLIMRESDRLSRLLSEFLDFSRVRVTRSAPMDLQGVVRGAVRLVGEHPDRTEGVVLSVEGESVTVEGDEDLLHRVVSNLTLNAVQAAKGPVHITVTTGVAAAGELPAGAALDRAAKIVVADNGPGIPEEVRPRLFEPFVSGRVGGSGLGLSIVQRAVEAHRGLVFVDSTLGVGTTFTIYLPLPRGSEDQA